MGLAREMRARTEGIVFRIQRVRPRTQHSDWRKMTGPINMTKISGDHCMASENPSVGLILEAFRKHSIEAKNLVDLKHEQEKAVNLSVRRKGCFCGYANWIR